MDDHVRLGATGRLSRRLRRQRRHPRPVVMIAGISDGEQQSSSSVPDRYVEAILRAGGLPLIRPSGVASPNLVSDLLKHADALLVPGGRDLDTERLGLGPVHPKAKLTPAGQQDADVALVAGAIKRGLPVLGICYGMQLLGVVGGGRLHQHLPDDAPGTVRHIGNGGGLVDHEVGLAEGTRTGAALGLPGGGPTWVRSSHHQALAGTGTGWVVTARDSDGLIEGIEYTGRQFAIGVQWHPERAKPGSGQYGLFDALIAAAR
jgi:putative glutamine amidotransferase